MVSVRRYLAVLVNPPTRTDGAALSMEILTDELAAGLLPTTVAASVTSPSTPFGGLYVQE
jgi:hypothetical protein